jgi:hypothetical protein
MISQHQEISDKQLGRVISMAFAGLVKAIENEPVIIIEGTDKGGLDHHAVGEISSWLFRKRCKDGYPDNRLGK